MPHLKTAKEAIIEQSEALKILANDLPKDFSNLIDYILKLDGRVIMIGMGKSSYIAKKLQQALPQQELQHFLYILVKQVMGI